MAPSIDCTANFYCSEDVFAVASDDDTGSYCEEDTADEYYSAVSLGEQVDVDEPISVLVEKEGLHMPHADYLQRLQGNTIDLRARQNAVRWLLKVRTHYNFGFLTAALSVNYLDRFLSLHKMPNGTTWMLQLLSVACLSLASKMEETEAPLLLDLQVEGAAFIFEPRTIQRMELLVLRTLDWRVRSVTAFSYIDYLIMKIGIREPARRGLVARINDLLLGTLTEKRFLEYRPSVIAIAAALCAIKELVPVYSADCMKVLFPLSPLKDSSQSCLQLMEELTNEPFCLTLKRKAFCKMPFPQSPVGVIDASFSCNSESAMRLLEFCPSVHLISLTASKKKKIEDFCSPVELLEAL